MRSRVLTAPLSSVVASLPRQNGANHDRVVPISTRASTPAPPLVALLRPGHWLKNGFVLVPLLLTPSAMTWPAIEASLLGLIAFCAVASAVYVMNDYMDRAADRNHPTKRFRPLAAGTVSVPAALATMSLLFVVGFAIASRLPIHFFFLLAAYLALNVGYSTGLKRIPIADVLIVALGFVVRVQAGASLIGVVTTKWITIMTGLLALLLALGKRRDDVVKAMDTNHRSSLAGYNKPFLDNAMTAVLGALLVTYLIYTTDPSVVWRLHGNYLFYTTPFVAAGIMRYLQLLFVEASSSDPTEVLMTDRVLQGTILGWALCFGLLLYS
jgi:decaprenyl-phosphate phosphoribosyltransferase